MNFKDEYKKAAGDLTPDKACIDRMKAAVLRDIARPKTFPYKRVAVVGGAFAACAVITVAAITVIPRLRSSAFTGETAFNSAMSSVGCDSAVICSGGDAQEAGEAADTDGTVSSQTNSDAYIEEAAPAEACEDMTGRTPTVGGPMSEEASGVISHGLEESEAETNIVFTEEASEALPVPSPSDNEEPNPCVGGEPFLESICVTEEAGTCAPGKEEVFPFTGVDASSQITVGINETGEADSEEFPPPTGGYVPPVRDDGTIEAEAMPQSEGVAEETNESLPTMEQAEGETGDAPSITGEDVLNPCTGVPTPSLDGIEIIAKEELFGGDVTALRIVGNSAMIMNGDNVMAAYEVMFVPVNVPSESIIPRTGAAIEKYGAEGEYLVCCDDKKLIYVFDRQSEVFINAYRKIS